jgi:DNA-binding NarL/FixJ family response regulator
MQVFVISPQGYQRDALCCLLNSLFPTHRFQGLTEQSALDALDQTRRSNEGLVISTQPLPLLEKSLRSSQREHLIIAPHASTETLTGSLRQIFKSSTERITTTTPVLTAQESNPLHPQARLSPRQVKVLSLLIEGETSKEIAKKMKLSPSTIKTHISAILRIFQVRTRLQLMRVAHQLH